MKDFNIVGVGRHESCCLLEIPPPFREKKGINYCIIFIFCIQNCSDGEIVHLESKMQIHTYSSTFFIIPR